MIKFPSLDQYRTAIRSVKQRAQYIGRDENGDATYNPTAPLPTLKYEGTVKLHGTNAGIVYDVTKDTLSYQSRERELSLTSDNAGFMLFMSQPEVEEKLREKLLTISQACSYFAHPVKEVALFGEWCGAGIQKGVAISELPKMFVTFAVKVFFGEDNSNWVKLPGFRTVSIPEHRIFSIYQFPTYEVEIDFEKPEVAQNEMIKITEAVENECPVGKHFGVSGVGEGVVWMPITPDWYSSDFWFKVKGEKHSVSKVKTLAPIDVELIATQRAFIESVVTEARLEQGLHNLVNEQLKPFEMSSLGDFIRWVFNDVIKEEMDTIVANQYDPKKLGSPIADVARKWYINKFNSEN